MQKSKHFSVDIRINENTMTKTDQYKSGAGPDVKVRGGISVVQ